MKSTPSGRGCIAAGIGLGYHWHIDVGSFFLDCGQSAGLGSEPG